jgi:hypothetical protein
MTLLPDDCTGGVVCCDCANVGALATIRPTAATIEPNKVVLIASIYRPHGIFYRPSRTNGLIQFDHGKGAEKMYLSTGRFRPRVLRSLI